MLKLRVLFALAAMLFAATAGFIRWQRLAVPLRALVLFCALGFVVVGASNYIRPNHWLFNLYMPFEMGLPVFAATTWLHTPVQRRWLIILTAIFLISYCLNLGYFGLGSFASYAVAVKCAIVSIIYLMVLFKHLSSVDFSRSRNVLYLCFAFVVYNACSAPMFGMMQYAIRHMPGLHDRLFYIVRILSIVQYLLIGLFFLTFKSKSATAAANEH